MRASRGSVWLRDRTPAFLRAWIVARREGASAPHHARGSKQCSSSRVHRESHPTPAPPRIRTPRNGVGRWVTERVLRVSLSSRSWTDGAPASERNAVMPPSRPAISCLTTPRDESIAPHRRRRNSVEVTHPRLQGRDYLDRLLGRLPSPRPPRRNGSPFVRVCPTPLPSSPPLPPTPTPTPSPLSLARALVAPSTSRRDALPPGRDDDTAWQGTAHLVADAAFVAEATAIGVVGSAEGAFRDAVHPRAVVTVDRVPKDQSPRGNVAVLDQSRGGGGGGGGRLAPTSGASRMASVSRT